MPRTTHVRDNCARLDLSHAINRSGFSASDLSMKINKTQWINTKEGSCSRCNQLTRLLRTSFSYKEIEELPNLYTLEIHSLPHPFLTGYNATYFSIGSGISRRDERRYLLPLQPHFVESQFPRRSTIRTKRSSRSKKIGDVISPPLDAIHSDQHTHLSCVQAVDLNFVNYNLFNNCIKLCQSEHSEMCDSTPSSEFAPTRLIDCKNRVLCAAPNSRYVCLSYVWGDAPADKATSDNTTLNDIPQTISDAMFVTLQLGMRYLWVDRYCIDQTNADEKHDAIRNMDSIYRNGYVTIIAAAGSDSDYGLPGVSRPRKASTNFDIEGHAFTLVRNPRQVVQTSIWNTRGWTYQEMLLSQRRLIFTDFQVYFQCQRHQKSEQLGSGPLSRTVTKEVTGGEKILPTQSAIFTVDNIYSRLEEYYTRTLRYETDNINAFAGVFRELSGRWSWEFLPPNTSRCAFYMPPLHPHFYGIPLWLRGPELGYDDKVSSRFGLDLGWRLEGRKKEILSTHCESVTSPGFPSWSWASTKNHRPEHDRHRMVFFGHPRFFTEIKDANFRASVTHISGERMSMSAYVAHMDDYTLFHPWIDVVAWTTWVYTRAEKDYSYIFVSGQSQSATVHLDDDTKQVGRPLKAIYIGMATEKMALFLLVEKTGKQTFRRIGICETHDGDNHEHPKVYSDLGSEIPRLESPKRILLEKIQASLKWQREELRII